MPTTLTSNFGISITAILAQLVYLAIILVIPILNIRATQKAIRAFTGATLPLWILTIWLLPIVGFICAFAAINEEKK